MKKRILLLFILCSLFVKAQTTIYHEFPDSNATWNFHYSAYCAWSGHEFYSVTITGDTVINSETWRKLYTPYIQSSSTSTCRYNVLGYLGSIREDVPAKKVYFIPKGFQASQLLYDFNLNEGDTVKGYTQLQFTNTYSIVQKKDSILVGGSYRARWLIDSCYNIYFIEGIGSTYGLIGKIPGCMVDQPYWDLLCFSLEQQPVYPGNVTQCDLITSVSEQPAGLQDLNVFPNPSSGSFTIRSEDMSGVKILDVTGRVILNYEKVPDNELIINNLPIGTYIMQISFTDGRKSVSTVISL